jgi:uridylate kinase
MQIDAKWGAAFNIISLILALIAAGTMQFAGLSTDSIAIIKSYAFDGTLVLTAVNSVLHLYSAPNAGPLAK